MPENWALKWDHRPSRVPGCRNEARRSRPAALQPRPSRGRSTPAGRSRTARSTRWPRSPRAPPRRGRWGSSRDRSARRPAGWCCATCPSWPIRPVSWVTSGTCWAGNQAGISRSTEMNVIASPSPTSIRATSAAAGSVARASGTWPAAITRPPSGDDQPGAEPIDQQPDRDLHRRVDDQLDDRERGEHRGADAEAFGRRGRRDAERGALEDRHRVRQHPDPPDQPGRRRTLRFSLGPFWVKMTGCLPNTALRTRSSSSASS